MKEVLALSLLILLGTLPLPISAQVSVAAVDLQCINSVSGENSSEGPLGYIYSSMEHNNSAILNPVNCTVTNVNAYAERIQIEISADGLYTDIQQWHIDLGPGVEESFDITMIGIIGMMPGIRILNITATVVEANGAPPPNTASDNVEGEIWVINDEWGDSAIHITGVGPFKSSVVTFVAPNNGTTFPVLYLKESWHMDAILTDLNGQGVGGKCLNIYIDPQKNIRPLSSIHTRESDGIVEWFSGDPSQNPGLKGVETTGGELEGFRLLRVAFEPDLNVPGGCDKDTSNQLIGSHMDIVVLVRSRVDLQVKTSWDQPHGIDEGTQVKGEVVLLRDRLDLAIENETVIFYRQFLSSNGEWITNGENISVTNEMGIAQFNWTAEGENSLGNYKDIWRIVAFYPGSILFEPSTDNITYEIHIRPDTDADGVIDEEDAFPNDADETHDDDGDGVGNNSDEFPQDPDEQFDSDGDGIGNNADDFPNNGLASNWITVFGAVGILVGLLLAAGVMISRIKKEDELSNVSENSELDKFLEKQIQELQEKRDEIARQEDPTELLFGDY